MGILDGRLTWHRRVLLRVLLALLPTIPATVSAQAADEYQVKAAFLYNFTKFVEWPASPDSSVFTLCILGDDPFGSTLEHLVKGKTVYTRPIQVRRLKNADEARQCHIVFVAREQGTLAAKLVEAVHGLPILTVGEQRLFGSIGGMIYLASKDDHVDVVVNMAVTEKAGLKVSAKLMSVAKQFKRDEGGRIE